MEWTKTRNTWFELLEFINKILHNSDKFFNQEIFIKKYAFFKIILSFKILKYRNLVK